jgi:hypothetical protein
MKENDNENIEQKNPQQIKILNIIGQLTQLNYSISEDDILIQILDNNDTNFSNFLKNYKILLKLLSKYINSKMILKYELKKIKIFPPNNDYFWGSKSLENTALKQINKVLIILNDPFNYPGIFSNNLLFFDTIYNASVFKFIELAEKKKFPVIILNVSKVKNNERDIDLYLDNFWKLIIENKLINLTNIIFIAYKNASISLIKLLNKNHRDFEEKIKKILLINSSHKEYYKIMDKSMQEIFSKKTTNYILSNLPVGSLIYSSTSSLE